MSFHRRLRSIVLLALGFIPVAAPPVPALAYDPREGARVAPLLQQVRETPADRAGWLALGEALRREGRIESRRLAAEQYRLALKRWPRDPDLLAAFGQLRVEQGFLSQGAALYRRALKADPRRIDAEFGLARLALRDWLRFIEKPHLEESRRRLTRVLALEPDHRDALYFRALVQFESGQPDSALDTARELARRWPTDAWGDLLLGAFAAGSGQPYEATQAFEAGLSRLPAEERAPFESLLFVDWRQAEAAEDLPSDALSGVAAGWWHRHDPTPASPLNERLVEHRRRVVMAELLYGIREKHIRGYDTAPGEALIRYGLPGSRTYTSGFPAPMLTTVHHVRGQDVSFDFVDANLSGRWLKPMSMMPTSMDAAIAGGESEGPEMWTGPSLEPRFEVAQFRGEGGGTRLELYVAAHENGLTPQAVMRDAAVYDTAWAYLGRDTNHFDAAGRISDRRSGSIDLVDVIPLAATGDSVWVGASVEARSARSGGSWMKKVGVRRFDGAGLQLSDLLLLDHCVFAAPDGRFARRDGEAIPNPRRLYLPGESVPVYFEAYNLRAAADGTYPYALLIQVEDAGPPNPRLSRPALVDLKPLAGPRVTARFAETGTRPTLERLLDVAVGTLPPGPYRLRVTLEQPGGGGATGTASFRVVAARPGTP